MAAYPWDDAPPPWTPEQETERRKLVGDLRRLDTVREHHVRALREVLIRAGFGPCAGLDFDAMLLDAHDLRKALEPFDTGEVPF